MEGFTVVVILAALFIALVILFATLRLFSIDSTLKDIRDELRARPSADQRIDLSSIENPTSMLKL